MQRWAPVVIGAVLVAVIGALVWKGGGAGAGVVSSGLDAGAVASGADDLVFDAGSTALVPSLGLRDEPLGLALSASADPSVILPAGSPKTVRFGVILIQYRGAQMASPVARSKDEARAMAHALADAAKVDWKAQVPKGDPGSMEDAGRIPRGILEPAAEYALFTMTPGSVSEPIDTPRGFWIARRIE
jgi:hypothetical protein